MPNVKFSGFNAITSVGANGFLVGYDSVTNLNTRITLANLKTSLAVGMNDVITVGQALTAGTKRITMASGATFETFDNVVNRAVGLRYQAGAGATTLGDPVDTRIVINSSFAGQDRIRALINNQNVGFDLQSSSLKYGFLDVAPFTKKNAIEFTTNFASLSIDDLNYLAVTKDQIPGIFQFDIYDNLGGGIQFLTNTAPFPTGAMFTLNAVGGPSFNGAAILRQDASLNTLLIGNIDGSFNAGFIPFYLEFDHTSSKLQAYYNGIVSGISMDFPNSVYVFGDSLTNFNYIQVDSGLTQSVTIASTNVVQTNNGSSNSGLLIDFTNEIYGIGDTGGLGSATQFFVDDANGIVKTRAAGTDNGLLVDFNNSLFKLGNYSGGAYIEINDSSAMIESFFGGSQRGLSLDGNLNIYEIGDPVNGTFISIDGPATTITTNAQTLVFDDGGSGTLLSNTSSGNSGQHLVVTIDGTIYHIKLEIP